MSGPGELLLGVLMLVGIAGVVVPVLPGLLLVWASGVAWAWFDGGGVVRWSAVGMMTLLLGAATVAKYALPARSATGAGAPRSTLLLGALGALVGFFAIPVLGLVIGGVGAMFAAELARLGSAGDAWRSTWVVLRAIGIGMLIELAAAVAAVAVWGVALIIT
jgi:uncharacterized protein YqgC (DUF456 family)